jgi:hypothetical protein
MDTHTYGDPHVGTSPVQGMTKNAIPSQGIIKDASPVKGLQKSAPPSQHEDNQKMENEDDWEAKDHPSEP